MFEFEEVCLQHEVALPARVRSVRRDVRAAMGNYFGGSALVAIDAEMGDNPVSESDPYWQDISLSHVEYVMNQPRECSYARG